MPTIDLPGEITPGQWPMMRMPLVVATTFIISCTGMLRDAHRIRCPRRRFIERVGAGNGGTKMIECVAPVALTDLDVLNTG